MNDRGYEIVDYLLDWYGKNARCLAWRQSKSPYHIWVSEIMLQQTRVEAVKAYFDRFTKKLPDIKALSEVSEDQLMKLWQGLGYYNRARNLQKAARILMLQYGGDLPSDYAKLKALPGIGSYTAGAIASIAFGIPVPAVDGNVMRVMMRIKGGFDDIMKTGVKNKMEQEVIEIIPKDKPGEFNQALMELGALVCIPNGKPLCSFCPVMHLCKAHRQNLTSLIPVMHKKKPRKKEEKTILLIECQGRLAIRKRPESGLLSGLFEFPSLQGKLSKDKLNETLTLVTGGLHTIQELGDNKHIFTHIEWQMSGYLIRLTNLPSEDNLSFFQELVWAAPQEIHETYSLPSAYLGFFKAYQLAGSK